MDSNFSVNKLDDVFRICFGTGGSLKYFFSITFLFFSFLTISGNLLVITSIIYFKQLHTPTNFLILSLAVSDLLVGIIILTLGVIPINDSFCWLMFCIDFYLCSSSVLNLFFISVDRYYAVCQPLKYRTKMNVHVSLIMILLSWTLSTLSFSIVGLQAVFCFYIPAIIMCAIYLKILMEAQRQVRSIQNTTCQSTKSERKMERKATKTLAIVMGVYVICWAPFFFYLALSSFLTLNEGAVIIGFKLLGWSNSLLNPFIYGFFYSWFRSAFRMIITGKIFQGDFTHSKLS